MNALRAIGLVLALQITVLGLYACLPHPSPPPTPNDQPDAPVADIFYGITVECGEPSEDAPVGAILECSENPDVDICMTKLADVRTRANITCTARDLSQSLHIASKTSDGGTVLFGQAKAIDDWLVRHLILIRSN